MANAEQVIHTDPEILGGTPVFVGTRVPMQALIDYLEGGHPLADFLDDFPTVSRSRPSPRSNRRRNYWLRILLDECVPRGLKRSLRGYQLVLTVPEAGFAGLKNGELLQRAVGNFDLFITTDKSIQYQQNLPAFAIAFVHLRARSNDIADIEPLVPELLARFDEIAPGTLLVIG